jgi:hypothetical protein
MKVPVADAAGKDASPTGAACDTYACTIVYPLRLEPQ